MTTARILHLATMMLALCGINAFSQQIATTQTGKTVLLKSDGTWEYSRDDSAASRNSFAFRKSNWGMNKKQVKVAESLEIIKDDPDFLVYNGNVAGIPAYVYYIFVGDRLVRSQYRFRATHTNRNDFISDFSQCKQTLTEKYGSPKTDTHIWRNNLYKDDPDQYGFAVSLGHLLYRAEWETETTTIVLQLSGENYSVDNVVEYSSKQLTGLEDSIQKDKAKSEF